MGKFEEPAPNRSVNDQMIMIVTYHFSSWQYIVDNVSRALENYNVDDEPTCFVYACKQRMQDNSNLDDVNLMTTCSDFFLTGQETTTTTLRWAMIIMAKHEEIQMPYARDCVLELQRFANILGTNVQRTTTQEVTIRIFGTKWISGPEDSRRHVGQRRHPLVMDNDPAFVKPDVLRPEPYLTDDGTSLRKNLVERTIPFSMGKRAWAGGGLARVEIFLGLTATVQRYRILPRNGVEIDLEPTMASTIKIPKPQGQRLEKAI